MSRRRLFLLMMIICMGSISVAYAWWDNLKYTRPEEVLIGEGLSLIVNAQAGCSGGGKLIPSSAIKKPGDTYEFVIEYTVKLSRNIQQALCLVVEVQNIKVGGVDNPFGLIEIVIIKPSTVNHQNAQVKLLVSINDSNLEEEDYEAAYLALASKLITFDVCFRAVMPTA